jgi:hypothetical protein
VIAQCQEDLKETLANRIGNGLDAGDRPERPAPPSPSCAPQSNYSKLAGGHEFGVATCGSLSFKVLKIQKGKNSFARQLWGFSAI